MENFGLCQAKRSWAKPSPPDIVAPMLCRLCGAPARALVSIMESVRFGELSCYERCPRCGYIQILEDYLPSPLNERTRYLLHRNDPDDPGYRNWLVSFADAALFPFLKAGCEVLDFGSGPSPALRGILEDKAYGYTPYDPFFAPGEGWRARFWPAIVVHEVAEHLRHPGAVLSELAGLLEPEGILALRTRFPPESSADFARWHYRMDSTHVGFFSKACLRDRLEGLGLRLVHENGEDTLSFQKAPIPYSG